MFWQLKHLNLFGLLFNCLLLHLSYALFEQNQGGRGC